MVGSSYEDEKMPCRKVSSSTKRLADENSHPDHQMSATLWSRWFLWWLMLTRLSSPTQAGPVSTIFRDSVPTTTFCVIADIPYDDTQAIILKDQIKSDIPNKCLFLLHMGDLRKDNNKNCTLAEYRAVADTMKLSPVPVFMNLGDNDAIDCGNPAEALQFFEATFKDFDTKYWNHTLQITRQPGQPYNFEMKLDQSILIVLRMVNGPFPNETAEIMRLEDQFNWTKTRIRDYVDGQAAMDRVGRVVIAAHADPGFRLNPPFFLPLRDFIANDLNNSTPILYINGDTHVWGYNPNFYAQPSFLQIVMAGEAAEPPTVFFINNDGRAATTDVAFTFDRQLPICAYPFKFLPLKQGINLFTFVRPKGSVCIEKCALPGNISKSKDGSPRGILPWKVGRCPGGGLF